MALARTLQQGAPNTSNDTNSFTSAAFTPAAGRMVVAHVWIQGITSSLSMTNSAGLTVTAAFTATLGGANKMGVFSYGPIVSAVSQTVTFNFTGTSTGREFEVMTYNGAQQGTLVIRQVATNTGNSGTAPSITFSQAPLTTSNVNFLMYSSTNPPGLTAPTGSDTVLYATTRDSGYVTPTTGTDWFSHGTGETNTTITCGSNSGSNWQAFAYEVQTPIAYTLSVSSGSYSETGTTSGTLFQPKVVASSGTFTETGSSVNLPRNYKPALASGSYTETGTAATLTSSRKLTAASGSYSMTGTAANLTTLRVYSLAAGSGAFTETGTNATLRYNRVFSVSPGSYSMTGTAATFPIGHHYDLTAESGSFGMSGTAVTFHASLTIFRYENPSVGGGFTFGSHGDHGDFTID